MNNFNNWLKTRIVLMALFALFISHNTVFAAARISIDDAKREGPAAPAAPTETKSETGPGVSAEEKTLIGEIQAFFERIKKEIQDQPADVAKHQAVFNVLNQDANKTQLAGYIDRAVKGGYKLALRAILLSAPENREFTRSLEKPVMDYLLLDTTSNKQRVFILMTIKHLPKTTNVRGLYDGIAGFSTDVAGRTCLQNAAAKCSGEVIKHILDIIHMDTDGDRIGIQRLLGKQDDEKNTAAHIAVNRGDVDVIVTFMEDKDAVYIAKIIEGSERMVAYDRLRINKELHDKCKTKLKQRKAQKKAYTESLKKLAKSLRPKTAPDSAKPAGPGIASAPADMVSKFLTHDPYSSELRKTYDDDDDNDNDDNDDDNDDENSIWEKNEQGCGNPDCPNCSKKDKANENKGE